MSKIMFFFTLTFTAFVVLADSVPAQFTIVLEEVNVPEHVVQKVADDRKCSTSEDMAGIPGSEYLQVAENMGKIPDTEKTTINVDRKGLFAAETIGPNGKMTMVYNGKFNMIMWDMKKVIQTTPEEMKGMATQAESMMGQVQKNMPDISKFLDNANLTEEQKASAMRAMPGMFGNKQTVQSKPTVKVTDKTRTILGMPATLYLIKEGNITKGIWASDVDKELAKKYREVGEKFEAMIPMKKKETDEWELLPEKHPLEKVEVFEGGYSRMGVKVSITKEINRGNPPAKAYYVPGKADGFQVGGRELMMGSFMNR